MSLEVVRPIPDKRSTNGTRERHQWTEIRMLSRLMLYQIAFHAENPGAPSVACQCGIVACVSCALVDTAEHIMFVRAHQRSGWVLYDLRTPLFGSPQRLHSIVGGVGD